MNGLQRLGDLHRAVRLLVILENRDQRTAHGQRRIRSACATCSALPVPSGAELDVRAPRLERLAVASTTKSRDTPFWLGSHTSMS